jgi:cell division protein FtsQ
MVVIGAAVAAMVIAALAVWVAIGAMPDISKNLPIERVVFVSATSAPLAEVDGDELKRLADALRTRGATMLQVDLVSLAGLVKQVHWVREATIRRQFPSTIVIAIEEHKPVAQWVTARAPEGENAEVSTLVNSYGDVFNAVISDERRALLPELSGPEGSSTEVLTRYASLLAPLKAVDRAPRALTMTPRRAWQLTLDNGTSIELGRTDTEERIARFVRTYNELPALQLAGASVDLRYQTGLTIRNVAAAPSTTKAAKTPPSRKRTA